MKLSFCPGKKWVAVAETIKGADHPLALQTEEKEKEEGLGPEIEIESEDTEMVEGLEVVHQGIIDLIAIEGNQNVKDPRKAVAPRPKAIHPVAMENRKVVVVFSPVDQQLQLQLIKI